MRMAGRFVRLLKAWAKANGVPVIYRTAGERKHEIAERYLAENTVSTGRSWPWRPGVRSRASRNRGRVTTADTVRDSRWWRRPHRRMARRGDCWCRPLLAMR